MHHSRVARAAGLGVVGMLALAGCAAGAPQDAGEAWQQARTQLDEADSLRLTTSRASGNADGSAVTWDIAGQTEGEDNTAVAALGVGEDSRVQVETRVIDGQAYGEITLHGQHVPEQVRAQYGDQGWKRLSEEESGGNLLRQELDRLALPAADALQGSQAQPEEVEWSGGTGLRYAVPAEVAEAARQDDDDLVLRDFTVDEHGSLVGLRVESDTEVQQYTLGDWNEYEPAEVPEEVSE